MITFLKTKHSLTEAEQEYYHRQSGGFTLTEMLATMLIMVLASTLLATGVPVAIDTYHKTVKSANAQLAFSTTVTVLRSELGLATDIRVKDNEVYYCSEDGYWACIRNPRTDETFRGLVKQYCAGDPPTSDSKDDIGSLVNPLKIDPSQSAGSGSNNYMVYPLIPDSAIAASRSSNPLWVRFDSVSLSNDRKLLTFNKLYVFEDVDYNASKAFPVNYDSEDLLLARLADSDSFSILIRFASN